MLQKMTARSVIAILLVVGSIWLAVNDPNFRPAFGDLVKIGIGGYLGQLTPSRT